jgi:CSLREA domain-containing protein
MKAAIRLSWAAALSGCLLAALLLGLAAQPGSAAGFTVNTLIDESDGNCGGDGDCSLRDAIAAANTGAGSDAISFNAGGVISITLGQLVINGADGVTIDGDLNNDGAPDVEVHWTAGSITSGEGLINLESSGNRIEGLSVVSSTSAGIFVDGNGKLANDNEIVGNWIGLDLTGAARPNATHGVRIVHVTGGSSGAENTLVQANVLSGNTQRGLSIQDAPGTQVLSNTIGLDPTGSATRPNGATGMSLFSATATTLQGNLVSGNTSHGVYLTGTQQVTLTGNAVGLNAAGSSTLGNQGTAGVYVDINSLATTLRSNIIAGNTSNGVLITGTTGVVVAGNKIGVNAAGAIGFGNGRTTNRDGVQIVNAYSNTIGGPSLADGNIIAHNGRAGVFISGAQADHNVIQNNTIGAGVNGTEDLGNGDSGDVSDSGDGGVYIADGADYNLVQDNLIRFNYIGLRFNGGSTAQLIPPQNNQALDNTLTSNDKYGVVNQTTHANSAPYATPAGGDNLIQSNTISGTGQGCVLSWCTGIGVFNYGGSPRVLSNTVSNNKYIGIVNRVYFGTDGPANAADDLLSMPYIAGNTIGGNNNDGIQSRDTTPLNKVTLLQDNTFSNNNGAPHISQRWFVAVEVVSNTQTLTSNLTVTITRQNGGAACPGGACTGATFASAGGSDGIWGASSIAYNNVENDTDGTTTWFEVIEREVDWQGNPVTYTSHLVRVGGAQLGSRYFDFDGVTTTQEISGEVNLPFCRVTGILTDPANSLCRYQIAQVNVFAASSGGDADNDGIPDATEGSGDTDGDGTPDYQDTDSDGDGIPDSTEGSGDADGDGTPNFQDTDSDGNGIPDGTDGAGDTDGDATPDFLDADDDGDGISDSTEITCPGHDASNPCDSDGDATPDYQDTDSDNDGLNDSVEGSGDADGDGTPNFRDTDADGNGILDQNENTPLGDADGDTTPNFLDTDDDGDGVSDLNEITCSPGVGSGNPCDSDGDATPDYRDTDSDNDGLNDSVEGSGDPDGDGRPNYRDTDSDGDGLSDQTEGSGDADGDSTPNFLDLDSDGNGINDASETSPTGDPDNDGAPNFRDLDDDGDGLSDASEYYSGVGDTAFCANTTLNSDGDATPNCTDNDADGDGTPNYRDTDSDGDGRSDASEGTGDADGDGVPNWLDPHYYLFLPVVTRNYP